MTKKLEDKKPSQIPIHDATSAVGEQLVDLLSELAEHRKVEKPKPGKFSAFGIEIGGWGALLALVVSILTAGWTAYSNFFAQPQPRVERPIILNLYCSRSFKDEETNRRVCREGSDLVLRVGPFLFSNDSMATNYYLVKNGRARIRFTGDIPPIDSIDLRWQFFSNATNAGISQDSAAPIQVASGQPQAVEIEFFPRRKFNEQGEIKFINAYDFFEFQRHVAAGKVTKMEFQFSFEVSNDETFLETTCTLTLGDDFKRSAASGIFTLYSRDCDESQ